MKEKKLLTGWRDVFSFTFYQGVKGKGFQLTTIGITLLLFAAMVLANVIMAYQSEKKVSTSPIETVYVWDESGLEGLDFSLFTAMLVENTNHEFGNIQFESVDELKSHLILVESNTEDLNKVGIHVTKEKDKYLMEMEIPKGSAVKMKDGEKLLDLLVNCIDQTKLVSSGIEPEKIILAKAPVQSHFTEAGEEQESVGEMLTKLLVPMFFCLILYMMVLLYGQSIGKIVIAEKASKLMEMLLTSVKPYAIITGKVLAMASIAVIQMLIWIAGGVVGFFLGDAIAQSIAPQYENVVMEVATLLSEQSGNSAFSIPAVIIAIFIVCFGFFLYSVTAGLVASSISKSEDLAQGMSLYQMLVIFCFFGAYLMPLQQTEGPFITAVRLFPFTAAFILPGDLVVGNAGIAEGCMALAIIIALAGVLIILTGKIYKNKIFYRGEKGGIRKIFSRIG